jgi:hypothetical protein
MYAHNERKYVADLKLELEPKLPWVPCFLGEFNQCILNFIVIRLPLKPKPGWLATTTRPQESLVA